MHIKICGLTNIDDLNAAINLGATAIGLVFYPPSKRYIDLKLAIKLRENIPQEVLCVALIMNENINNIKNIIENIKPDILQFHGDLAHETPEFCAQFGLPYWKAVGMKNFTKNQLLKFCEDYKQAEAWVLDSHEMGIMGGSGEVFDWQKIPKSLPNKIIVAGGLNPDNVAEAIRVIKPYGADVSSGVEFAAGRKCADKMARFIGAAKAALAK